MAEMQAPGNEGSCPMSSNLSHDSSWSVPSGDRTKDYPGNGVIEPIAIIGLSCRLPGSAQDPFSLWDMLVSGRTAWTPGSGKRFNMKAFQDPTGEKAGATNTCGGHFLKEDITAFDASFFGINPVEATAMDPQHRLLLEIAYESFQNAGLSGDFLWGSNTGVYVGQWSNDYHEIETRDIEAPPLYLITGTGPALSSNRISYHFNLRGPSFTIDTGCSSSLVALHQAIQSLRSGETTQCFVGGVNLLLDPQRFVYQSKLNMFSKEGRSFAFDSRANGYGRGEGCAGVMLKPLSAALRDGNHVRAVIRNSVLNQDGRTPGITVPNSVAQQEAILKAYGQAMLDLQADYVEAHGTGTMVGDPNEARAIAATLAKGRPLNSPLPMGSIKANIGHTEGAAGLAGLIKAVLMLEHGIIPPQANYETTNPDILLDEWNLRIPTELEHRDLRRISVNSFGYGGTNAHVIVDSATEMLSSVSCPPLSRGIQHIATGETLRLFFLSAASEKECQRMCRRLAKYLVFRHQASPDADKMLARLAYSLGKQSVHNHRLALVASNLNDLVEKLSLAADSIVPRHDKKGEHRIAFVFNGQGAQYAEMGRELLDRYPTFAQSIKHARQLLFNLGSPWDLLKELRRPKRESQINEPAISQPSTTAIQLSLVDLLAEFGVSPCAVVGHSSGEIAAAYATGAISFEESMAISYFRGQLTGGLVAGKLEPNGAMLAVGTDPAIVDEHIATIGREHGRMRIACYNSPSSVTVSGDSSAVDMLKSALDAESIFNRKLLTNGTAYHSHQMEAIEKEYAAALKETLAPTQATIMSTIRTFSSVTGRETKGRTGPNADYWVTNLLSPVLFSQAVREMCEQEFRGGLLDMIVEVGPHSQLEGPVNQILKALQGEKRQTTYTSAIRRGRNAEVTLLECLGSVHVRAAALLLDEVNEFNKTDPPSLLVDLPPYPFNHERTFWHETRISKNYRHREHLPHELLGTLSQDTNRLEPRWRRFLSLKETPWLRNHLVQGQIVFPAAGFLTMAVQAMRQHTQMTNPMTRIESLLFRNISISKALVLPEDGPDVEIILSLRPQARTVRESSNIWNEFRVFTVTPDDNWTEHCRGLIQAETQIVEACDAVPNFHNLRHINSQCIHETSPQRLYHLGRGVGLDWQHPFDNVSSIRTSQDACIITARQTIQNPNPGGIGDILHPTVLDSCLFHGLCGVLILERDATSTFVPNFIKQLRIFNRALKSGYELISTSTRCDDLSTYDVVIQNNCSSNKELVIAAEGVHTTTLPGDTILNQSIADICHSQDWVPYIDAWTLEHRNQTCKSMVPPANAVEENRILDALTLHYVQEALKNLPLDKVADGHRRHFLEWMQSVIKEKPDRLPLPDVAADLQSNPFVEGVLRLGPHLSNILTDDIDPLVLLTPDNLLSRLYNADRCERCIIQIAEYCHQLGRHSPGLKVLEVGAGTASATLPVMEALNGRCSRYVRKYDFTDISPGFFEPAKDRLGQLADVVEFSILDIEYNPKEQGFEEGSYDLIIASNVIHATQRIDPVLANIRKLLKPGGKFILMELTQPTPHYNLLFGIFKGWWAGYDEGRRLSPLIPRSQWIPRLELAGFSDPDTWFEDYPEQDGGTISVFVATAPWDVGEKELPPVHAITTDSSERGAQIVEDLENRVKDRTPGVQISTHCLSTPSPGENIVIILPEVARLLCNSPDVNTWQDFKNWILRAGVVVLVSCGQIDNPDDTSRGLWLGFTRCLRLEHPNTRLITLDLSVGHTEMMQRLVEVFPLVLYSIKIDLNVENRRQEENEFAERDGQLFVSRLIHNREVGEYIHRSRHRAVPDMVPFLDKERTLTAELGIPGLLESLRWKDDTEAPSLGPDDVKFELRAASVNFKDVLIAAGQLEGITEMRNDCGGVVVEVGANMCERFKPGDRVCALYSRSYTNYPIVHGDCCQIVPDSMSFEEAAALPVVWTTVYYSLIDMGRLSKGDRILIHSAAGAVGQAAIMLAQHIGAEIFVTVGSSNKSELLHEKYGIAKDHMFSSRTSVFFSGIKRLTNGYGVDVVLNSLADEMFRHSCNLVAPFGRFVEIGRKDLMDDAHMPMGFLLNNITFAYVDLTLIMQKNKPLARRLLQDVTKLFVARAVRPVTLTAMPISEIETAFRQVQAGKHTGKIVLRVEENQQVKAVPSPPPQVQLRSDATILVVGGLGGLGRAVIAWLVERGAKHILSVSRSGAQDPQSEAFIEEIEARGVKVAARRCDVTSRDEVNALVHLAERDGFPPIRGVIHGAMVLKDSVFEEMTVNEWQGALAPKIQGTLNLHHCFGNNLDFFIVMSSAVGLRGNVGQSNYAAGCTFQDAVVRCRTAAGMPAYSINIGPVMEVGFVSENAEVAAALRRQGLGAISVKDLLAMFNYALTRQPCDDPAKSVCAIGMLPNAGDRYLTDRRFAHLTQDDVAGRTTEHQGEAADLFRLLDSTAGVEDAIDTICQMILQQLGKLIATPAESLNPAQSLDSYGVDSLVAVELRNWIGAYLQANVQLMVLRGASSIKELAKIVAKESRIVNKNI